VRFARQCVRHAQAQPRATSDDRHEEQLRPHNAGDPR
jgi:hypothetical protein